KDNVEKLVKAVDDQTVLIDLSDQVTAELLLYRLTTTTTSVTDALEVGGSGLIHLKEPRQ
ncbi:hypothetical protein ACC705_35435, partial [Rhizobium ruizarguesonis]